MKTSKSQVSGFKALHLRMGENRIFCFSCAYLSAVVFQFNALLPTFCPNSGTPIKHPHAWYLEMYKMRTVFWVWRQETFLNNNCLLNHETYLVVLGKQLFPSLNHFTELSGQKICILSEWEIASGNIHTIGVLFYLY